MGDIVPGAQLLGKGGLYRLGRNRTIMWYASFNFAPMRALLLLLAAFLAVIIQAQEHRFTRFGLKEGLPSLHVTALEQDSSRQIWVGTITGLSRFDGQRFHNYFTEPGNQRSLAINTVSGLLCDRQGALWVSTGPHLHRYDPTSDDFTRVGSPAMEGYIHFALQEDRLWMHDVRDVYAMTGTGDQLQWEPMPFIRGSVKSQIMQLRFEGDTIWVVAANGLWKGSFSDRSVRKVRMPGMPEGDFIAERCERLDRERLLLTTWGKGFFVINEHAGSCAQFGSSTTDRITFAALPAGDAQAWVGTDEGLLFFDADKGSSTHCTNSTDDPWSVHPGLYLCALRDHEGNVWFGGRSGLMKRDVLVNTVRSLRAGPPELITTLREVYTGMIVIGQQDALLGTLRGVHRLHAGALQRMEGLSGIPGSGQGYPMLRLDASTVLVGLENTIGAIDLRSEPLRIRPWAGLPELAHAFVRRTDGKVLVITDSARAYQVSEGGAATVVHLDLLKGYVVGADLFEDRWLLVNQQHYGSVVDLSTGKATHFSAGDFEGSASLSVRGVAGMRSIPVQESYFTSMRFSSDGRVLLGSRTDGLLRCERNLSNVEHLRERMPSIDRSVLRILPFGDQQAWLSTHNGMLLLDLRTGASQRFNAEYGLEEGPHAAVGVTAGGALMKLDMGRSIFIDPHTVPRLADFSTRIASVLVNGALVARAGSLDLPSNATSIRVGVVSSTLAQHGLKRYRYRLIGGATESWTDLGGANEIVFDNLAPGSYSLEVRSSNALGRDDNGAANLAFSIAKPFYLTWWFIVLIALVPVTVAALLFRARIQRIKEAQLIRDRIARDLHDDLGSSMSAITIYGGVLEKKLSGIDSELGAYAGTIHRAGKAASEAVSDIVWAEDPGKDSLAHLVSRVREHLREATETAGIEGTVQLEGEMDGVVLDGQLRRELFLIFKEAVNNAMKYAGARSITLVLSHDNGRFGLRISDDGCGFDIDRARPGNGLLNMRRRAEGMGARFELFSRAGEGTQVMVEAILGPRAVLR